MIAWADIIVTGKEVTNATVPQGSESNLDTQRLEFEIRKYEEEREFRLLKVQRTEQKGKEEREIRRQEIEFKRQGLRLREEALERKDGLAARIKFYGDAIRNTAFKMGNDQLDISFISLATWNVCSRILLFLIIHVSFYHFTCFTYATVFE